MKPPSIVIDHFLSTKWSKKLFTINHYELQNGKCIVTQELSAYKPNSNPFRIDKKQTDGIWTMDEIILMRKLKRKDEWALGKIIDLYSSYITYIVWELLHKKGTKEDIEEVVADTFISLWLTAERINYKKYSSVKSYLGMIARNKAKDWLRAYRGEILELNDDILLIDGDVEHLILQKEQQLIIGRTLEKLRETDRKIFIMYYYRYKKIEEIAETLKMNPQTVKTRLRRGRETLKRILLEEGYDASEV